MFGVQRDDALRQCQALDRVRTGAVLAPVLARLFGCEVSAACDDVQAITHDGTVEAVAALVLTGIDDVGEGGAASQVEAAPHTQPRGEAGEGGAASQAEVAPHTQPRGEAGEGGAVSQVEVAPHTQPRGEAGEGGAVSQVEAAPHTQPRGEVGEGGAVLQVETAPHTQPRGEVGEGGAVLQVETAPHTQPRGEAGEGGAVVQVEAALAIAGHVAGDDFFVVHDISPFILTVRLGHKRCIMDEVFPFEEPFSRPSRSILVQSCTRPLA